MLFYLSKESDYSTEHLKIWQLQKKNVLVFIRVGLTDLDIYTVEGWKFYEEKKRKIAESKKEIVNLESEDELEIIPRKQISITLQGPKTKIKIKVLEVHSYLKD
jgi:hypothetical protein